MQLVFNNCQSCGMPLNKDPKGGGTDADGTKSTLYCSYCFSKGRFTAPDMTVNEMKEFVKSQLKKMGFPGFIAGWFTQNIPKLERWKTKI